MNHSLECKLINHRGHSRIALVFDYNKAWHERVKKTDGSRWSKTLQCWHIPDTGENRKICRLPLPQQRCGESVITAMSTKVTVVTGWQHKQFAEAGTPKPAEVVKTAETLLTDIKAVNQPALKAFIQALQLKSYSQSTIRTYKNEFGIFLKLIGWRPAESFCIQRIKDYLQYCHATLHLSEHTLHSRINALKFYYEQVLRREKFFWEIPRPKKPLQLPKVLSEDELARLFNSLGNLKHKAMLFTAYSAGLRVSEIVSLKLGDIDSNRMQILVRSAKGKQDRYVNLSPVLLDVLRKYITLSPKRPTLYLFESGQGKNLFTFSGWSYCLIKLRPTWSLLLCWQTNIFSAFYSCQQ